MTGDVSPESPITFDPAQCGGRPCIRGMRIPAIITKDEDFVGLHHRNPRKVMVVWVRLGNASRQELLDWFLPLPPRAIGMIEGGETLIEMRQA